MREVKVVTPDDLGLGLELDSYGGVTSKLLFYSQAAVADLGDTGVQLVFRHMVNSDKPMVITGISIGGKWYGDSPDDTPAINPFTGETTTVDNGGTAPVRLGE